MWFKRVHDKQYKRQRGQAAYWLNVCDSFCFLPNTVQEHLARYSTKSPAAHQHWVVHLLVCKGNIKCLRNSEILIAAEAQMHNKCTFCSYNLRFA